MEYTDLIIQACPDGVVICDSTGVVQAWNGRASELFGWSAQHAVGKTVASLLIPVEDQKRFAKALRRLATGEPKNSGGLPRRMTVLNEKGDRLAVRLWYRTLRRDGKLQVIGFLRSPQPSESRVAGTTLKSLLLPAEPHMARSQGCLIAGEKENLAKSEFLANITHELHTPMNAILGMTELALHEELPNVVRDYLLTAKNSADTMLSLINHILDFSRLEAGRFELDQVPFDIRRLLDETMRSLSLRAHEKGLELASTVHAKVPLALLGDPIRLRQMLTNLVSNAIKFTESGEVVVTVVPARSDEAGQTEWNVGDHVPLHFCVTDTGIGIDPNDQQRIFAPFAQVDTSMTRSSAGAGLGLSICSELARLMNGRIRVESSLGKGSRFHLTADFAVAAATDERLRPVTVKPEQLQGMRVLIVDNNETTRRILTEMVESWAMRASTADSVDSAICQMETATKEGDGFPLLIVDATMPQKDGIAFLEQIEDATETVGAAILMMSPADQHLFRKRAARLRVGCFLEKPVSQSSLLNSICEAIGDVAVVRTRQQVIETASEALNILVAEDIPANQKVVRGILTKRGHNVTIAHNGREAIELYEHGRFDLVLMDVQMPILDGLQATKTIRGLEKRTGKHTPVIATTALALRGDREACLAAGMDVYMSKPLDAQLLLHTVEQLADSRNRRDARINSFVTKSGRWRFRQAKQDAAKPVENSNAPRTEDPTFREPWQPAVALRRMGDDKGLLCSMVEYFLEDSPVLLQQLHELIATGDSGEASRVAHSLKGLCANFEADAAIRVAGLTEIACREGKFIDAASLLHSLNDEIRTLSPSLESWQRENAA